MNEKQKRPKLINHKLVLFGVFSALLAACSDHKQQPASATNPLPYFGEFDIELTTLANGTQKPDTLYYPIPKFSFVNQDSAVITRDYYEGYITLV